MYDGMATPVEKITWQSHTKTAATEKPEALREFHRKDPTATMDSRLEMSETRMMNRRG